MAKTKALISCVISAQLICIFVFAYAKIRFSHTKAHALQDIDETVSERLWGLTEMFPNVVRNSCSATAKFSVGAAKFCFSYGRSAMWILTSSFIILVFPVVIENQRELFREEQEQQQRQVSMTCIQASSQENKSWGC